MADDYIIAPGATYEPGDIFEDIAFPNVRHPFRRYRLSPKPAEKNRPEVFVSPDGPDKVGDLLHCTFERKRVMILSHGCELDKVLKQGANPQRRHWSCAPLERLGPNHGDELIANRQQRIREGTQWNRFYLPPSEFLNEEYAVDLRRITPLPAQYFLEAKKLCSLSEDARYDLYAQVGVNFSGLAVYAQPISCPHCGEEVDPQQFLVSSGDDPDEDVD